MTKIPRDKCEHRVNLAEMCESVTYATSARQAKTICGTCELKGKRDSFSSLDSVLEYGQIRI